MSLETAAPPKFGKESENLFQIIYGWNKFPAPIVFLPSSAFRVSRYDYARFLALPSLSPKHYRTMISVLVDSGKK